MIVASVDIGTNTILLLLADVNPSSKEIKVLENFYRIPRIGKGLTKGSPFPGQNLQRMFDVLDEYMEIFKNYKCEKVLLTGTNAFRIASDKDAVIHKIKYRYGFELNVIPGEDEAKYSYLGAVGNLSENKKYLVIDIGGGSTEIIYGKGPEIIFNKSFDIGVVSGTENFFKSDPPSDKQIKDFINYTSVTFSKLPDYIKDINTAIAIAGTPTTLAAIKQKLKSYAEDLIEGTDLSLNELKNFTDELSKLNSQNILIKYSQVVKGREDVLLAGTIILKEVVKKLNIDKVQVSTKGIRYGAILNWLASYKHS